MKIKTIKTIFFYSQAWDMKSDRVQIKIKNYAGIFRHVMQKNMLITRKTRKIIWKFKQFITLLIVSFHCLFFCYLNYLVRFLLLLRLFKFILTLSLINCKMILGDDERAKEDNVFKFPHASSSQTQFLIHHRILSDALMGVGLNAKK